MSFEPQNELERSLVRAAADPAHRARFYRDLLEADLYVIDEGPPPEQPGWRVSDGPAQLRLRSVEVDGLSCIPVFSSVPRLQAVIDREVGYVGMRARDLLGIVRGADLVLNPGSDYGKVLTAAEVRSLLDGSLREPDERHVVQEPREVLVGQPASYPTELVDTLRRVFGRIRDVRAAYLVQLFDPARDGKPHTLVGIETAGDWDLVSREAGIASRGVHLPDPPVDFMQVSGPGDSLFAGVEPFYRRKRFGLF